MTDQAQWIAHGFSLAWGYTKDEYKAAPEQISAQALGSTSHYA